MLTHFCPPLCSTFAVQETASLDIMGAPRVSPLCRETQSLGQQMLNATVVGMNGLMIQSVMGHSSYEQWHSTDRCMCKIQVAKVSCNLFKLYLRGSLVLET